jgi:2-polyprenyl-3-methyl-5-hydroxy-6-metoxy-1,4-benzoquinol methylase
MFVLHGELYARILEPLIERAKKEVNSIVEIFHKHDVPSNGKILDLCCGIGRHAVLLVEKGYNVLGVDISPLCIKRARLLAQSMRIDAKFIIADMRFIAKTLRLTLMSP